MINDLRHIRAVLQVEQTRNFTRAAQSLHVSQSALTVQIQQLEEHLGFRIFDRGKRGVTLTTAGSEVIGPLRRLLEDADNLLQGARNLVELRSGSLVIAALPTVAVSFLPRVLEGFSSAHAGIRVSILDVVAERVRDAVLKRQAEFGIGTLIGSHDELETRPLYRDRLVLFTRKDHPLANHGTVTLQEAASHQLILPSRDSSVRELVDAIAHRQKLVMKPRHEANFMTTALALVRSGAGVAILPDSAAAPNDLHELVMVSLPEELFNRQIVLLRRAGSVPSPAALAFLAHLSRFLPASPKQKRQGRRTG